MVDTLRDGIRIPTEAELDLGLARAATFPQLDLAMRFLLCSGVRLDEALALRSEDLDRRGRLLRLRSSGERIVHLSEEAVRCLDPAVRRIFWAVNEDPARVSATWLRLRTGACWFRLTDLRHAYAVRELSKIVASLPGRAHPDIRSLSQHLGHRSVRTTEAYRKHLVRA